MVAALAPALAAVVASRELALDVDVDAARLCVCHVLPVVVAVRVCHVFLAAVAVAVAVTAPVPAPAPAPLPVDKNHTPNGQSLESDILDLDLNPDLDPDFDPTTDFNPDLSPDLDTKVRHGIGIDSGTDTARARTQPKHHLSNSPTPALPPLLPILPPPPPLPLWATRAAIRALIKTVAAFCVLRASDRPLQLSSANAIPRTRGGFLSS